MTDDQLHNDAPVGDAPADPRVILGRALDQAGMVIARVTPDQVSHPTPCASWDIGALANHMITGLDRFRAAAAGETVDWNAPRPDVAGDWPAEFRTRADALIAVWAAVPDLTATRPTAMGDLPLTFVVNQQLAEVAQHSWDLAAATAQRDTLDDGIASAALGWARQALKPEYRGPEDSGKAFGEERFAPDGAPARDQLAAYFGRDTGFGAL